MNNITSRRAFFILCWSTYVCTYLCRINFSSAMTKLGDGLKVGSTALGLMGSLYFVSYAIGQLLNGFIGDKVVPEKFILLAISGTAVINFLISFSGNYGMILVLWCINGFFQSMFWGPLMRMLSQRFPPESKSSVSTGMSCSMMAGYILSWSVLGKLLLNSGWENYFLIPSLIALVMLGIWAVYLYFGNKDCYRQKAKPLSLRQTISKINEHKLWGITIICMLQGIIKESLSMWAPVILIVLLGLDVRQSLLYLLLFPLGNFGGILLSGYLSKRYNGNIRIPLIIILGCETFCAALILIPGLPSAAAVVLMAVISAAVYGGNNILLGIVPLSYSSDNIVSTLVGIFDFSSYMGAAVVSFILGIFLTGDKLGPVAIIWLAVSAVALAVTTQLRIVNLCGKTGGLKVGSKNGCSV